MDINMENNKYKQTPPDPQEYRKLLETLRDESGWFYRNYEGFDLDTNTPRFRRRRFSLNPKTPGRDRRVTEATLAAATLGLSTIPNMFVRGFEDEAALAKIGTLREMAKALDVDGQKQHREQVLKQNTEDISSVLADRLRPYTGTTFPYIKDTSFYREMSNKYGNRVPWSVDNETFDWAQRGRELEEENRKNIRSHIQDSKKSSQSGEFMEKNKRNPITIQETPELPEHLRFNEKAIKPLLYDSYDSYDDRADQIRVDYSPHLVKYNWNIPDNQQHSLFMPWELDWKISFPKRDISTAIHENLPYMSTLPGPWPTQWPSNNSKK